MPDYQAEFAAALKAAQQPTVGGLAPPAPALPDYQAEFAAFLKPTRQAFGPPAPAAPYDFTKATTHSLSLGIDEPLRAANMAAARYFKGEGFNYPEAAAEVARGREAYASEHPYKSLGGNVLGAIMSPVTGPGGLAAKAYEAAPTLLGKIGTSAAIGAGTGGIQGAAENTTSLDEMLKGARIGSEWGGGIGAAVPTAGAIAGAAFPQLSPELRTLRAHGIQPTPGTIGGVPSVVEGLFSHLPFAGPQINAGQAAAQAQLQDVLKTMPAGPARNATGQFVAGTAPFAAARKGLLDAGDILPTASKSLGTDVAVGAVTGTTLAALLFEHPELIKSPWLWGPALGSYGAAKGLNTNLGRWATTGGLGLLGEVPPAISPLGPLGAQLAPGLLHYNQ